MDWQQMQQLIPLALGAIKSGSPEGAAMMQGYLHSQQQLQQRKLQQQHLASQDQLLQAQVGNLSADNARADQQLQLAKDNAGLTRLEHYRAALWDQGNQIAESAA